MANINLILWKNIKLCINLTTAKRLEYSDEMQVLNCKKIQPTSEFLPKQKACMFLNLSYKIKIIKQNKTKTM